LRRARVTQVAPEPRSGLSNTVHSDGDDRLECILGPPVDNSFVVAKRHLRILISTKVSPYIGS